MLPAPALGANHGKPASGQPAAPGRVSSIVFHPGGIVRLYVVQMFYSSLKESAPLVAEAKNNVAALSKKDFVLMGFGEHTAAIAFASEEPETNMRAQFERIRGENFSLIAFEAAWIVGGNMSKDVSLWLERHQPSPFK
jgi:hypothetical protein